MTNDNYSDSRDNNDNINGILRYCEWMIHDDLYEYYYDEDNSEKGNGNSYVMTKAMILIITLAIIMTLPMTMALRALFD